MEAIDLRYISGELGKKVCARWVGWYKEAARNQYSMACKHYIESIQKELQLM